MSRIFGIIVGVHLAAVLVACDKVALTAPTGSAILLSVNTSRVPTNGTAEIIATVTEQAGTAPQNGTVVTFSASLGIIEPSEARTEGGRVVVRFVAGSQSGTATVNAVSGGAQATTVEIQVGGAAATAVSLRAEPSSVLNTGGTVTIVASVRDTDGNRLPGIPVSFSSNGGQLSAGQATTDANGEARATLTTTRETIVTVSAGGLADATLTVPVIAVPAVVIATTTTEPQAGIPVNFTVTPQTATNANALRDVVIDFGDGTTQNLGAIVGATPVPHVFQRAGTFTVTATSTDVQGLVGRSSIVIVVGERAALGVSLTGTPNPVTVAAPQQGLVSFTATVGATTSIQSFEWSFGDGGSTTTTGSSVNHRYSGPGTYIARVRVRATNGQEGSAEYTVRVTP